MLDDPSPSTAPIVVRLVSDSAYEFLAKIIEGSRASYKLSCPQSAPEARSSLHEFDLGPDPHRNTNDSGRGVDKGIDVGKEVDKCYRCVQPNQERL